MDAESDVNLDAHRAELLRVFKNTPRDIDANRDGRIGPDQARRLRRSVIGTTLTMVVVVAVFAAIIAFVAARPISPARWVLIAVVALAGLAVGVHRSAQLRRALRDGTVERLSGIVSVGMRGRAGWWLTVSGRSFHLPVRFWHVGPGLAYRVYVAALAQLVVAMEPEPASPPDANVLVDTSITFTHTADGERPFTAIVSGATVLLQVNDFPAEPLYSVYVDGVHLTDLDDWPPAWTRPGTPPALLDLVAQTPRGAAIVAVTSPLNAATLGLWATALCTTPAADTESVLRALRFDGPLVDALGYRRLTTPPAQTLHTDVTEAGGELRTLRFTPSPVPVTRRDLDAEFGDGHELVRIHWDSAHRVVYRVVVDGAPFACDVTASFREAPIPAAIAYELTLTRRQPPGV